MKWKEHFASVALLGGFFFDVLTIRRADALWENLAIILHLLIVASVIFLLSRREKREDKTDSRLNFWLVALLQFSFGGLLSAFLILYFRSASLIASWPFLLILFIAFLVNERMKGYHERLLFQIGFFYLSLLTFLIFSIPILVGAIGPLIFIVSGVASLVLIKFFFSLLTKFSKDKFSDKKHALAVVTGIFAVMNVLYFSNIIPPIPLSLKDAGVYHSVSSDGFGKYILVSEPQDLVDRFRLYRRVNVLPGSPLFAYTAVFSPSRFNSRVVHEWQRFDEVAGKWQVMSRVSLPTSGGRAEGFRTYSTHVVSSGKWRVNVLSEQGLVLGRVPFIVSFVSETPVLTEEIR